jgi:hypothetical protein
MVRACAPRSDSLVTTPQKWPADTVQFHGWGRWRPFIGLAIHKPDVRALLVGMVCAQKPKHHIDAGFKPCKVIYASAPVHSKRLTADTLFTFS